MKHTSLMDAKTHLIQSAQLLGRHVAEADGLNSNVLKALDQIDQAIVSTILAGAPVLQPHYDHEPLTQVMHVWGNS